MPPRDTIVGARRIHRNNAHITDDLQPVPQYVHRTDSEGGEYYVPDLEQRVYARALFGARFPTSPVSRDKKGREKFKSAASIVKFHDGSEVLQMQDPYNTQSKARFEDAYRTDPIVRRAINVIAKFTLGKKTKTVINLMPEYLEGNKTSAEKAELSKLIEGDDARKLKHDIERINRRVNFHEKLKAAVIQSKIGGRGALLIEGEDDDGFPMDLKVLNWKKLGTVYVDKDTWRLKAVEYNDMPKSKPLLAEQLIYITNQDFHVTPDSLFYGLSEVEPIAHVSECNRLLDEEDFKEANRTMWAHHGLIKFPPNVTDDDIDEFLDNFNPGTWNGTSQDVIIETHNLNINMNELVHERNENDKRILRALGVPAFLIGFEDVTNRATTVAVLHAWRESELHDYRTWLQDILQPQWFDRLSHISLPSLGEHDDEKIRAQMEFEDITYESNKEKVEAMLPLYQAGLVSKEKVLKVLDFYDELERAVAEREDELKLRLKELELVQKANNPVPPASNFDKARTQSTGFRKQQPINAGKHDEGSSISKE